MALTLDLDDSLRYFMRLDALARVVLAFLLVASGFSAPRMQVDAARAMAMAAGALCLADGPAGMPEDGQGHGHCAICLGSAPVIGLAAMHGVMPRVVAAAGLGVLVEVVAWRGGRAAYASRAPPGLAG